MTFADAQLPDKQSVSLRGRAIRALIEVLQRRSKKGGAASDRLDAARRHPRAERDARPMDHAGQGLLGHPLQRARPDQRIECEAPARDLELLHRCARRARSEEHTSELQSPCNLVCRLLLEKKNKTTKFTDYLLYQSRSSLTCSKTRDAPMAVMRHGYDC